LHLDLEEQKPQACGKRILNDLPMGLLIKPPVRNVIAPWSTSRGFHSLAFVIFCCPLSCARFSVSVREGRAMTS